MRKIKVKDIIVHLIIEKTILIIKRTFFKAHYNVYVYITYFPAFLITFMFAKN